MRSFSPSGFRACPERSEGMSPSSRKTPRGLNYLKVSDLFTKLSYFDRIFSDMHDMPFKDNGFDIIFGAAVMHHTNDLAKAFKEIHRVLKPGGNFVLINESARGVFEKVHPVYDKMKRMGFGDTCYTRYEWKKGARFGGFKKIKVDFLSLADDYITRHEKRGSKCTIKLRLAHFIKSHPCMESFLLFFLRPLRLFFRPKSWRMVGYKYG
jgi:SAM-dependent methyltransferase